GDGRPRFDRIVVDCPSTGHGIKFLRVAQIVRDASRVGPMAEKTRMMADLVANPARTRLHIVALPEELPVNEARELVQQVRESRAAALGLVFFNQRLQRLFDDDAAAKIDAVSTAAADLDKSGTVDRDDEALRDLVEVAKRRRQREQLEREMRGKMEQL